MIENSDDDLFEVDNSEIVAAINAEIAAITPKSGGGPFDTFAIFALFLLMLARFRSMIYSSCTNNEYSLMD